MAGKKGARLTSAEARQEFVERMTGLWETFNEWYQAHPEATFDEMEAELGRHRREVLGDIIELSLRQRELGAVAEGAKCPRCGREMEFKGYRGKNVHGLEVDIRIPRAYYYCASCKAGFFPPGPSAEVKARQLE